MREEEGEEWCFFFLHEQRKHTPACWSCYRVGLQTLICHWLSRLNLRDSFGGFFVLSIERIEKWWRLPNRIARWRWLLSLNEIEIRCECWCRCKPIIFFSLSLLRWNGKTAIVETLALLLGSIRDCNESREVTCFSLVIVSDHSSMNSKLLIFLFCSNFLLLYSTTGTGRR